MWDLRAILSPRIRVKKPRNHAVLEMTGFLSLDPRHCSWRPTFYCSQRTSAKVKGFGRRPFGKRAEGFEGARPLDLVPTVGNVSEGRRARLHGRPREGPEFGRKPAFQCEPEIEFTARSGHPARAELNVVEGFIQGGGCMYAGGARCSENLHPSQWSLRVARVDIVRQLQDVSRMIEHLLDPVAMDAIEGFMAKVCVPILYDDPAKQLDQVGTGTLFEIDARLFLITASHLLSNADPSHFAIPNPSTTVSRTLGQFNLFCPTEASIDVAVLELLGKGTMAHSRASWNVLTLENVHSPSNDGVFVLSGYPGERAKRKGEGIAGSLLTTYSRRIEIPEDAEAPVDPQTDLFLQYSSETVTRAGETIKAPHLGGTSGASVWEYRESDEKSIWTPEQCLKIVGVQCAFRDARYFRAKSWSAVLSVLQEIDDRLAALIRTHRAGAIAEW